MDEEELYPLEDDSILPVPSLITGVSSTSSSSSNYRPIEANFTPTLFTDKSIPIRSSLANNQNNQQQAIGLSTFGRIPLPNTGNILSSSSSSSSTGTILAPTTHISSSSSTVTNNSTTTAIRRNPLVSVPPSVSSFHNDTNYSNNATTTTTTTMTTVGGRVTSHSNYPPNNLPFPPSLNNNNKKYPPNTPHHDNENVNSQGGNNISIVVPNSSIIQHTPGNVTTTTTTTSSSMVRRPPNEKSLPPPLSQQQHHQPSLIQGLSIKPLVLNNSLSSIDSVSSDSDMHNAHLPSSHHPPPQPTPVHNYHHHHQQQQQQIQPPYPFPSPSTPIQPPNNHHHHNNNVFNNSKDFSVSPSNNPLPAYHHPQQPTVPLITPTPSSSSSSLYTTDRTDLPLWLRNNHNTVPNNTFVISNTWLSMLLDTSLWFGVWDPVIAIRDKLPGYEEYGLPENYTQDIPTECRDQQELISTLRLYNIYNLLHAQKPAFSGVISLIVRIRSIHPTGDINWTTWFEDPTGYMLGMIWKQVMEEYGKQLRKGSVLLLRNVSVFCMGEPQILSIKTNNIVRIWNADESDPRLV